MSECHDSAIAGHVKVEKTLEVVQRIYYWPKMHEDVTTYVQNCLTCQQNKASNQLPTGLLQPLPTPTRRWEHVNIDLVYELPCTKFRHDSIVVFVDKLSKMIHIRPTSKSVTTPQLAHIYLDAVFAQHGLSRVLIMDRRTQFTIMFWKTLFELFKTKLAMSTAYHSQNDGQTERANRTIEDMLRVFTLEKQEEWDTLLSLVEFTYNNFINASTKAMLFYLIYGIIHSHYQV